MEQQTELIAAAHAVQTWVRAQRVTWAGRCTPAHPGYRDVHRGVRRRHGAAGAAADRADFRPPAPLQSSRPPLTPEPEPVIELPSLAPFLRLPEPVTSVYVESPRRLLSARLLTRAAVLSRLMLHCRNRRVRGVETLRLGPAHGNGRHRIGAGGSTGLRRRTGRGDDSAADRSAVRPSRARSSASRVRAGRRRFGLHAAWTHR